MGVAWVLILCSVSYSLYHKYQYVAACHAHLAQLDLLDGQIAKSEAQLDAAEAQVNGLKR